MLSAESSKERSTISHNVHLVSEEMFHMLSAVTEEMFRTGMDNESNQNLYI